MLKQMIRGGFIAAFAMAGMTGSAAATGVFPNVETKDLPDLYVGMLELSFDQGSGDANGQIASFLGGGPATGNFLTASNGPGDSVSVSAFNLGGGEFSIFGAVGGDPDGLLLSGSIIDFAFDGNNAVKVLTTVIGGSLSADFGPNALLLFSETTLSGDTAANFAGTGQVDIVGARVPAPAALPLLLTGLAGFGFVSRRRRAA